MSRPFITELTAPQEIRLVVSDLDGTLLNDYKEITPRALRAIAALQRQGIGFTVCTGREYATLDAYASQISPNAPMICNNGAEVIRYPTGEVINPTGLPGRGVRRPGQAVSLPHHCGASGGRSCQRQIHHHAHERRLCPRG